jgi:ribosome biogenesis SPOUT family RNA methylase Rps3
LVLEDGRSLGEIPYVEQPTIRFNDTESVEMPFRYVKDEHGEPTLPEGMRQLLYDDLDKSFDF